MIAPLNFLKVSFLSLTCLILVACHSDGPSPSPAPDINTFNIFTFDQTIYSFNEDTGISTKRGEFDSGENQFIELNTDESKQGYEYAAYVFENSIYLLNYDKELNAETIELTELFSDQIICGIYPHKTASQAGYSDGRFSNRSSLDLPIITIEYKKAGENCDPKFNTRDTLSFTSIIKDSSATNEITKSIGKSENVLGDLVTDYSSNTSSIIDSDINNEDEEKGSVGFMGKKISLANAGTANTLVFNYKIDGIADQWEKTFSSSNEIKTIKQASSDQTLIQAGKYIYLLDIETIFSINETNTGIPVQTRIDSMFSKPHFELPSDSPVEVNNSQNKSTFTIKQDNTLYFYESENFYKIPENETPIAQNTPKLKFDLTSDDRVLVLQELNNIKTLVAISGETGLSTTILSAEEIEFHIENEDFYVNTFELELGSGWQSHWFKKSNNNYSKTTYNNSRFIFIKNLQAEFNSIYLLSSDVNSVDSNLVKPSLYKYDQTESNGRKKGRSKNNGTVDFSYGVLNTDVSKVKTSIIRNDIYGQIVIEGINEDSGVGRSVEEYYFFNPSQMEAAPSIEEQSLTLIKRTML